MKSLRLVCFAVFLALSAGNAKALDDCYGFGASSIVTGGYIALVYSDGTARKYYSCSTTNEYMGSGYTYMGYISNYTMVYSCTNNTYWYCSGGAFTKVECTACDNPSSWSDVANRGYQSRQYDGTCTMSASSPSPGACSARSTEYRCKGGYYGTSTNCIACPQNSTCPAGTTTPSCNTGYYYKFLTCNACPENSVCNATDFVCNEGYIKDRMFQSSCILCPRNATCPAGSTTPTCNAGYYTYTAPSKEYSCARCAAADGVYTNIELTIKAYGTNAAGTGKTSASCKLPAGTYYDEIGTFTHTEDCEYTPSTT